MEFLFALVPVVFGTMFGLMPRLSRGLIGPLRTLAVVAALTVVVAELIPEAAEVVGWAAVGVFLLGLCGPTVIERSARWLGQRAQRRHGLALELAYVGLLVHQALDGAQIGAASHFENGRGLTFAVIAHSGPLVTVAVLGYVGHDGVRAGLTRAAGLAVAAVAGVLSVDLLGAVLPQIQPWLLALVAGVLLNIIAHDLDADLPRSPSDRRADILAAGLGATVPLGLAGHGHGPLGRLIESPAAPVVLITVVMVGALVGQRWWGPGVRGALGAMLRRLGVAGTHHGHGQERPSA